mmetsp:Transcript_15086/g.17226  ORF Transcript_15086/g.17226 Transcript_15086/m.17226 type:complete len:286 (+) Transcript_15086:354-1211(+)
MNKTNTLRSEQTNSSQKEKDEKLLSLASPTSIVCLDNDKFSKLLHDDFAFKLTPSSYHINLNQFIKQLPDTIRNSSHTRSSHNYLEYKHDPIAQLFRRLNISKQELEPFALIEPNKNYTRNLIATDDETFTLLLLCWNPGKYSPVHDHPCNGCWMRVCQGVVNEVRYEKKEHTILPPIEEDDADNGTKVCDDDVTFSSSSPSPITTSFECTEDTTFKEGEQTYIHDNLGYHKVGNPSDTLSISMHLYSPPFSKCKIWMDPNDCSRSSTSRMCNFSEYGRYIVKEN